MGVRKKILHIAYYGLIETGEKLLVVKKSRGPYKGLFDLAGGRAEASEGPLEALFREIREETGLIVEEALKLKEIQIQLAYPKENGEVLDFHHRAFLYRICKYDSSKFNPEVHNEDVTGALWIDKKELSEHNASPLLLRALSISTQFDYLQKNKG